MYTISPPMLMISIGMQNADISPAVAGAAAVARSFAAACNRLSQRAAPSGRSAVCALQSLTWISGAQDVQMRRVGGASARHDQFHAFLDGLPAWRAHGPS